LRVAAWGVFSCALVEVRANAVPLQHTIRDSIYFYLFLFWTTMIHSFYLFLFWTMMIHSFYFGLRSVIHLFLFFTIRDSFFLFLFFLFTI